MSADQRAQRVAELVKSALERDPSGWPKFLDDACAGDEELRAEVDSLLRFQEEASGFIEKPALHVAAETLAGAPAFAGEQSIAGYRVLSKIGEGGMGDVYLAEDVELHRNVALKLVRPSMSTAEIVSRFRREEQILASLNHPNIAQLYGGGATADGTPFFVMEYVEGARIDAYCSRETLSTTARLRLFRKVCAAVHYAHQHLIIHRDLKPSNILVTEAGEPKLLDFGIAKLLDPQDLPAALAPTLAGLMTPDYASPEQVRGETITTASDVYSLGVILYELLTETRPYQTKSRRPEEVARAVTEQEPSRPSTAAQANLKSAISNFKSLRGDLDNIVLMALRKEPQRRYTSVAQFSDDLRRHLQALPVIARKDTVRYRTEKFVCRHKLGVLAAALVLLAILVGLIGTLREKRRAERRFEDVRHLSNALLFEIAPKIERLEGATEARQSLLTQSLKYLDSLAQESSADATLQGELAAAYEKVGDLQGNPTNPNLMVLTDALASYGKANAMRQRLLEKNPNDAEQRRLLANNYRTLGDLRWQTNEPSESQKDSESALRLYTELLADEPASTELRLAVARTNYDIGQLFSTNEKHAAAIAYFEKVIASADELHRQFPNRIDVAMLLANGHQQMGNALSWGSRQTEGEAEMARAIEIYEPLVAAHPNDANLPSGLYQTYLLTSSVYESINDALASEYAFKAFQVAEKSVAKDPANLRPQHHLAMACSRVGLTLANIGKAAESIPYLERAVTILQKLGQNEAQNRRFEAQRGLAQLRLGHARRKNGDLPRALEDLSAAAAVFSELARDPSRHDARKNLASTNKSLAETHAELATRSSGAEKESHERQAREFLVHARDIFRQLAAQGTLSEFDRKTLEETEAALQSAP